MLSFKHKLIKQDYPLAYIPMSKARGFTLAIGKSIRLLGISLSNLDNEKKLQIVQLSLFEQRGEHYNRIQKY